MKAELTELERICESMRPSVRQYAELLWELAGDNALALTWYGAVAAGAFDPARHTARNVLVLESVDLEMLRRLSERGLKLGKARIAAPLIMTPDYVQASLDTFPLELIEIHQQHVTVFGKDFFDDLSFENGHVRLQCERELKVALIRMRQGLLAAAGRQKLLGELAADVADGLARILRGLLWLKGRKQAQPAGDVLIAVETVIGRSLPAVRDAFAPPGPGGWTEFQNLYRDIEALGKIVDAW